MGVQILEIGGQKMAVLPVADYERLIDLAEDRADANAAAVAEQRRKDGEEYLPSEMVDKIMAGESALRVWRKFRDLRLVDLSAMVGIGVSHLSDMERGMRRGSPVLWRRLAEALSVSADDILPDS